MRRLPPVPRPLPSPCEHRFIAAAVDDDEHGSNPCPSFCLLIYGSLCSYTDSLYMSNVWITKGRTQRFSSNPLADSSR